MLRRYADCDRVELEAPGTGTLGEVLSTLSSQFPELARRCLDGSKLRSGYLACVNGVNFTLDADHRLRDGDVLQLLSADVGGH